MQETVQLSERQRAVLRRVVEEFVGTGQPVGSKTLVERSDLRGALRWATTGVGLCLGRLGTGWDSDESAQPAGPAQLSAAGDPTELRLLLTLRYRIRVDLGLPEDDYDRLLDELPSGPATPAADS